MTDCSHPLCRDTAYRWVTARKGVCRAHWLEIRYFKQVQKQRENYVPHPRPGGECGTTGGAMRHYRRGEPRCEACRVFDNARLTEGRKRRKAAAQNATGVPTEKETT